jgi:molybdenum cofactor cytidylyltransferase
MPHVLPTALILASGRGERFAASGGATHKLDALLAGKPVLQHVLDAVQASGLPWHLERASHAGMGDCIAAAVAATPTANGWLMVLGDLPLVLPGTLQRVAKALESHAVVVPLHQGQRGHPVGFSARCRESLLALHGDTGAASVARAHGVFELPVNDIGCVTDVDTLGALAQAERLLQTRLSVARGAASA